MIQIHNLSARMLRPDPGIKAFLQKWDAPEILDYSRQKNRFLGLLYRRSNS